MLLKNIPIQIKYQKSVIFSHSVTKKVTVVVTTNLELPVSLYWIFTLYIESTA